MRLIGLIVSVSLVACSDSPGDPDASSMDASTADASTADAALDASLIPDAVPRTDATSLVACSGDPITAGGADQSVIFASMQIATLEDGFDLDGDQQPDNKLAAIRSLAAGAIDDAFAAQTLIVMLELFDYAGTGDDGCVDIAFYQGTFNGCGMTGENPCTPYDPDTPNSIDIDPEYVLPGGVPAHTFLDGEIAGAELYATPGTARLSIPVTTDLVLPIPIANGILTGRVVAGPSGPQIELGMLGGVMPAYELDAITGLSVPEIGLLPEDSLLDAYFANILGPILALPSAPPPNEGCRTPDIDIDGDGLEAFCDSDPLDAFNRVDVCIDGDGTVVFDTINPDQTVNPCALAVDGDGNRRFVDGISLALSFGSVPAQLVAP